MCLLLDAGFSFASLASVTEIVNTNNISFDNLRGVDPSFVGGFAERSRFGLVLRVRLDDRGIIGLSAAFIVYDV